MAKLMRHFDFIVKGDLDRFQRGAEKDKWLAAEDLPPRLLSGWCDDSPSMWLIPDGDTDPPDKLNILAALCRFKKKDWDKIAYILFDKEAVADAGFTLKLTRGNTKVSHVDECSRHFEVENLTARKVCDLVLAIIKRGYEVGVFKESECTTILYNAIDALHELQRKTAAATVSSSAPQRIPVAASQTQPVEIRRQQIIEEVTSSTADMSIVNAPPAIVKVFADTSRPTAPSPIPDVNR